MLILFKDGETSIILSAKVAWASSYMSGPVDASIILIDGGRRWRNNSRINAWSICCTDSLNSLCLSRNNWLGVRSPSSTVVRRVWSLPCSDTVVRRRSFSFSIEKGWSAGGEIIMSLTSIGMYWVKDATTYSYFVRWEVIPRVANCDSIWANHTRGSAVQNGGSLS